MGDDGAGDLVARVVIARILSRDGVGHSYHVEVSGKFTCLAFRLTVA
jgi:hypothetical protein